jgi:hypothetical protein
MNLYEKIEKLIPYINENFLTFPLWESDGKLIPFISFWQKIENQDDFLAFENKLQKLKYCYEIDLKEFSLHNTIYNYSINPEYKELEDGSFEFAEPVNLEQMLDDLIVLIGK